MAKTSFDTRTKVEKIKPKAGLQRRNSTGGAAIFNEPIPIPNYLRASIGSCDDLSKYGKRLESQPKKSELRRNINLKLAEAKSNVNSRVKKVPESKNLNTSDRGKVPESKNLGFPSSRKKPSETLKSTCNARAGPNGEIKKRASPLPRSPSPSLAQASAKIPVPKTRRSMSLPRKIGPAKPLERPERRKKPERESVEEKTVDLVEAKDEEQHTIEAKDENQNEGFVSSLDQKQEMDSEGNDSSPKKVELEREEEVHERENKEEEDDDEEEEEEVPEEKIVLRRAFSEGDFDNNKEKESVRIVVQMGKDKVKALVHAFEALITT